jgi:hypothetical protein
MLFMTLFFGCQNKNNESVLSDTNAPTTINIADSLDNVVERLLLSDAVADIDIVPLEVNEDHLFKRLDYVALSESDIFIGGMVTRVLRYNRDGKFINAIGSQGQGPNDFMFNFGAKLDSTNQTICIIGTFGDTNTDFKTLEYTLDGTFLKTGRIPSTTIRSVFSVNIRSLYKIEDNIFILPVLSLFSNIDTDCFSFLKYNMTAGEFQKFYNPANFGHETDYISHAMHNNDYTDRYWELFPQIISYGVHHSVLFEHNDTIYSFNSSLDSLQKRYILNCGDRPDFSTAHTMAKEHSFFKFAYVSNMLESNEYIYLVVSKNANQSLLQFNKRNGSIRSIQEKRPVEWSSDLRGYYRKGEDTPPGFTNDLCGGLPFFPQYVDENHWIARYEVEDLLEKIDIEKLKKADVLMPEKRDKLVHIIEHLDEDDNPVLMIATLK